MPASDASPILVTGAGGFIGTRLVEHLQGNNNQVVAHLGPSDSMPTWNSVPTIFRADIHDLGVISQALNGVESVVHLAGPPSVAESWENPDLYESVHVQGTQSLLTACIAADVKRFIYISSAEVYGCPASNPVTEQTPTSPTSPYGKFKTEAEQIIRDQAAGQIEFVILRPFSIYGPRPNGRSLLQKVIGLAQERQIVELYDLRPVRDYCHVDDLVLAITRSLVCRATNETINIGSGVGTSVRELASLVCDLTQHDARIVEAQGMRRQGEVLELIADITKAAETIQWRPTISLTQGLRQLIDAPKACPLPEPL